ncbi:unnamed protein product [Caenorhabditis angaria]|uniref:Uncharacterized protein n=1 Tax=Caenorhabditis angaria TaxID=860376 RepID=A0A9P1MSH6_9PELO|nr:unnamed protein product [Caenorhabditis angaria]
MIEKSIIFFVLFQLLQCAPSPQMCRSFAKFAERWNPLPETLLTWSRSNCDKIQPRPRDMSCEDVVQFVSDCNFSGGGPGGKLSEATNRQVADNFYSRTYENNARVLPKYIYYNENTARDYGQFGNWYYPNYYPPTYLGYFDGRPASMAQLENDYKFAKGGHYPYNRADNIINIGLQQTYLPTCLHDLFYCVRASTGQRPQQYLNYQEYRRDRDYAASQLKAEDDEAPLKPRRKHRKKQED